VLRHRKTLRQAGARGEGVRTSESEAYGERDKRRFTLYTPDELRERAIAAGFVVEELRGESDGEWLHLLARAE